MNVRDFMSSPVITVLPSASLREVAELLVRAKISGLPVVDSDGNLLGVVSEGDFVVKEQMERGAKSRVPVRFAGARAKSRRAKVLAKTAGEAMTSPAVTIDGGATVRRAAAIMTDQGINRLPVVEDGRLVGLLTRSDIVRSFLRSDDEIARAIRDEVLRDIVDPAEELTLSVVSGFVEIRGTVDRRSTALLLERLIRQLDGVVQVDSQIHWEVQDDELARAPTTVRSSPPARRGSSRDATRPGR